MMKVDEYISLERDRGACYKVLADCYYLPDVGLLEKINNPDMAICGLNSEMAGIAGQDDVESLQVDYSRLFVGPVRATCFAIRFYVFGKYEVDW
ncbi:MAG: hypothetical protein Q7J73_10140 [Dehalococcoidales bacterium]|nr:hypothetical protein [Dehalococcoidales bacterium]